MQMLVGGKRVGASDNRIIRVINPYTLEELESVPCATKEDVKKAIKLSVKGFQKWACTPLYKRIEILEDFISLMRANKDKLLRLMILESGKCISNAEGEINEAVMIFKAYCEKARNLSGEILPYNTEERSKDDILLVVREPLGVVACITPFNFPVELFAHKVAPALVTGNAVILKPSSDTPLTSIFMGELLLKAGVVPEAIQVITGNGMEIGSWLTEDDRISAVSFTGSLRSGSSIMSKCAKNVSRCMLELGGNDPLIVLANSDLEAAVSAAVNGRCWNAGQTCNGCKRFIVHSSVVEEFTNKLIEKLRDIKIGSPFDSDTVYGTLINETSARKVMEQVDATIDEGAICRLGGKLISPTIMQPTVLSGVTKEMEIAKDMEVFGPVWPIIGFDTIEEALEIANQSSYGLSSGIFGRDVKEMFRVANELECGACLINDNGCYRTAHQPYGGHKKSGIGVEGVSETLEEFTQLKTIVFRGFLSE